MDIHDSQRIKEIRDNTAKMADAFIRIADALERLADRKTDSNSEKPNNCEDEPKIECLEWYDKEGNYHRYPKTEPQRDYEKYLDKIRPHDPHKDWFEDEPQTERSDE